MTKTEDAQKDENQRWLIGLLTIILAIILFYWFFYGQYKDDDYASCVESCSYDLDSCLSQSLVYDSNRNGYVSFYNSESCSSELDSCIYDCEP